MKRKATSWWKDELGISTKAEVENKIRSIVARHQNNTKIGDADQVFLVSVLQHHYQYVAKIGCGLNHFEVCSNPNWIGNTRGLWIVRIDNSEIDISWVVALMPQGRPAVKHDVSTAARYEVFPQIHAHHESGDCSVCPLCFVDMRRGAGLHVDHKIPFTNLLADFLAANGLTYEGICIEDLGIDSRFKDRTLASAWQDYHRHNAVLRLTHAQCNLSRKAA